VVERDEADRRRLSRRLARRVTGLIRVAPLMRSSRDFHLSVAFDDCPDSACTHGVDLLDRLDARATFYVASGLLGQDSASGRIATAPRLRALQDAGHEIALHGHGHHDLSRLSVAQAVSDIERNVKELRDCLGAPPSPHFAYPYGETTLPLKRALAPILATARGVRSGVNRGAADRMQLFACDLGRHRPTHMSDARARMKQAAKTGGWVILFTHDVRETPSRFGVTPQDLDLLVRQALALGAILRPVGEVWSDLSAE